MANSLARFVMILTGASMLLFSFGALAAIPRYTGPATVHEPDFAQAALFWLAGYPVAILAVLSMILAAAMMLTGRVTWRLGAVVILGAFILFGSAALLSDIPTARAMAR